MTASAGPVRVLVTGGAGFVGSAYVRRLLGPHGPAGGVEVTVLDKLTHAGTLTNLASVLTDPRLSFVHGDVCDREVVGRLATLHGTVVHFADESHLDRSFHGAAAYVATNVLGTQTLLDAAARSGVGTFVHISTGEVYGPEAAPGPGSGSVVPGPRFHEEAPLAPGNPYAASKASADLLALAFHRTHGLDVRLVRAAPVYGPHQFPAATVPHLVTRLLDGLEVTLPGDGRGAGERLHVEDLCRAVELVRVRGRAGRAYNIGGAPLTGEELAGLVVEACAADRERVRFDGVVSAGGSGFGFGSGPGSGPGSGSGSGFGSGPGFGAWRRGPEGRRGALDSTRAREELGYRPLRDPADGLPDTVRWYRDHRDWWEPLMS